MKKILLILILSLIIFPLNCRASYTFADKRSTDYILNTNNGGFEVGGAARILLNDGKGGTVAAHCIDALAGTCSGEGATYEKSQLTDEEYNAAKNIYNADCGSLGAEDCQMAKMAAIKTTLVLEDKSIDGGDSDAQKIRDAYQSAYESNDSFNGNTTMTADYRRFVDLGLKAFNGSSGIGILSEDIPKLQLISVLYSSNKKQQKELTKFNDIKNSLAAVSLTENAIKLIEESGYKKIFESQTIKADEIEEMYGEEINCTQSGSFITCDITAKCKGKTDDEKEDVDVPPKDDDPTEDPGDDSGECEPQVYSSNKAGACQRMLSCIDENGNSKVAGLSGNTKEPITNANAEDDSIDDPNELPDFTCDGYVEGQRDEDDCKPDPGYLELQREGTELCMADGTTVVDIYELAEWKNDRDDEIIDVCKFTDSPADSDYDDYAGAGVETTEDLLKDAAKANEMSLEVNGGGTTPITMETKKEEKLQLCRSACTEDYKLFLPGPTSPNASENNDIVRVNAGTFFTIKDKDGADYIIHSETQFRCFVKPLHDTLQTALYNARKTSVDAHNLYRTAEAVRNLNGLPGSLGDTATYTNVDGLITYTATTVKTYEKEIWPNQQIITYDDGTTDCDPGASQTITLPEEKVVDIITWEPTFCYDILTPKKQNNDITATICKPKTINGGGQGHFSDYGKSATKVEVKGREITVPGVCMLPASYTPGYLTIFEFLGTTSEVRNAAINEYSKITSDSLKKINEEVVKEINAGAASSDETIMGTWKFCTRKGETLDFTTINGKVFPNAADNHTKISFTYEDGEDYFSSSMDNLRVDYVEVKYEDNKPLVEESPDSPSETKTNYYPCKEEKTCKTSCSGGEDCEDLMDYKDHSYLHGEEKITVNYQFNNYFCNYYDDTKDPEFLDSPTSADCKETSNGTIIKGFPVSIKRPYGEYSYRYSYAGIGHGIEDNPGTLGRLDDVINKFDSTIDEHAYDNTCLYGVNGCQSCGVLCKDKGQNVVLGGGCDTPFGSCQSICQVACTGGGCILDSNYGFLTTYKTISLNKFIAFENKFNNSLKDPSYYLAAYVTVSSNSYAKKKKYNNWTYTKGTMQKGPETQQRIENLGDKTYTDDYLEYSIDLTPELVKELRKKNEAKSFGIYDGNYTPIKNNSDFYYSTYKSNEGFVQSSAKKDLSEAYDALGSETSFIGPAWK